MNPLVTPGRVELDLIKHDMMAALNNVIKDCEVTLSQSHADCPVLIDKAWICTELMEHLPQITYVLRPGPLVMGFTELMAMGDPFDAFHPPHTAPLDTYDPNKPCYFFTLPRELRNTIYDLVISSRSLGSLSILRTSKLVREESTEFLYKRRIYHLNIHFGKYVPIFSLQKPTASLIQNIEIKIDLAPKTVQRFRHNIKQIRKFSGSIPRQTCVVDILFKDWEHTMSRRKGVIAPEYNLLMSYIRTLMGFSRLIIEFRVRCANFHFFGWNPLYRTILERSRQDLANQLGPSIYRSCDDPVCDYWEFHQRAHAQANPGALSPEVQRPMDLWTKYPRRAERFDVVGW